MVASYLDALSRQKYDCALPHRLYQSEIKSPGKVKNVLSHDGPHVASNTHDAIPRRH
jgi:hypothetical protein